MKKIWRDKMVLKLFSIKMYILRRFRDSSSRLFRSKILFTNKIPNVRVMVVQSRVLGFSINLKSIRNLILNTNTYQLHWYCNNNITCIIVYIKLQLLLWLGILISNYISQIVCNLPAQRLLYLPNRLNLHQFSN